MTPEEIDIWTKAIETATEVSPATRGQLATAQPLLQCGGPVGRVIRRSLNCQACPGSVASVIVHVARPSCREIDNATFDPGERSSHLR